MNPLALLLLPLESDDCIYGGKETLHNCLMINCQWTEAFIVNKKLCQGWRSCLNPELLLAVRQRDGEAAETHRKQKQEEFEG